MIQFIKNFYLSITILFLSVFLSFALLPQVWTQEARADDFVIPQKGAIVLDQAGVLSRSETTEIQEEILRLRKEELADLRILIPKTLQGMDIESYSVQVFESWKPGRKKDDNGLLLVIAPQEKKLRLEVGYGLEGVIPDLLAKRILDESIIPLIRKNQMGQGILEGVKRIRSILGGVVSEGIVLEGSADQTTRVGKSKNNSSSEWISLGLMILLLLISISGNRRLIRSRSSWRGGGWGGGFGGGGFGGGGGGWGGGSSGGGGASSGW